MSPTGKTSKSARKRGRPPVVGQRLFLKIKLWRWDVSWLFGLATPRGIFSNDGRFYEHTALRLRGTVQYPENFKYPEVECDLVADPRLRLDKDPPACIGSMQANGKTLKIYIPVYDSRLDTLISSGDRLMFMEVSAEPLRYRTARVMSINLNSVLEE